MQEIPELKMSDNF